MACVFYFRHMDERKKRAAQARPLNVRRNGGKAWRGRGDVLELAAIMTTPLPPGQNPVDPRGVFGMPPVPMPQFMPPPPPRRRGRGVLIAVLIIALVISVMVNLGQLGVAVVGASADVHQTVLWGEGSDKIAVVPIDGLIDDGSNQNFDTVLKGVAKDSAVKAVVIEIDTPGGSASAADEMYHRLVMFKNEKHVPVVIAMRGMATSGGYYVAAAGDYIFAEPGCLTGNIGVLMPRFNLSQTINKWGAYEETLTATAPGQHSYKNAGSMFQPDNPEDTAYLQGLVDNIFAQFESVVKTGRQGKLNPAMSDIFSGKAFIAADALSRGLIDKIGYPNDAYDYAAQLAGVTNKSVVKYTPNPSLLQLLTASSNLPARQANSTSGSISIDGFAIDARAAAELLTSRPLLLWRGN